MKILFGLLMVSLVSTNVLHSKCGMGGIHFYPNQKTIHPNSFFIIEGCATDQEFIRELSKRTLYLESNDGRVVFFKSVELLQGDKNLNQLILYPEKRLKNGSTYYLKIEGTALTEKKFARRNWETRKYEIPYWKVRNIRLPNFENIDIYLKNYELISFACGPEIYTHFEFSMNSDIEMWVRSSLTDLATGKQTIFYVKLIHGIASIGHSMCAGGFTYNNKGNYEVQFQLYDFHSGKYIPEKTLTFESPLKHDTRPVWRR